jgi:YggT family protein
MSHLIEFLYIVLHALLQAIIWIVVANAIMSWLVAFDVINLRNRIAYQVVHFLDSVTRPILRPFRRIIPPLGGVDITPVILIILVEATDQALLPPLMYWLAAHV